MEELLQELNDNFVSTLPLNDNVKNLVCKKLLNNYKWEAFAELYSHVRRMKRIRFMAFKYANSEGKLWEFIAKNKKLY